MRAIALTLSLATAVTAFAQSAEESLWLQDARTIDSYKRMTELVKSRAPSSIKSDAAPNSKAASYDSFYEKIAFFIEEHMNPSVLSMGGIDTDFYGVGTTKVPMGLYSHKMCRVTQSDLTKTLHSDSVPNSSTIAKANTFADRYNSLRAKVLRGDRAAKSELSRLWRKLFGCLAYTESLSTADTATSRSVARTYAPSNYTKPDGVLFYYDRAQSNESSRLNIGMFQFAPYVTGNIGACIRDWNRRYPNHAISVSASKDTMIHVIGSSEQHFNTFCGVNKVLQSFHTQANTRSARLTWPSNRNSNGTLVNPKDRCVSLHVRAGIAYNHFGPFQNSTGDNLDKLLSCALR